MFKRGHGSIPPCVSVVLVLGLVAFVTGAWLSYDRPSKPVVDHSKLNINEIKKKSNGQSGKRPGDEKRQQRTLCMWNIFHLKHYMAEIAEFTKK